MLLADQLRSVNRQLRLGKIGIQIEQRGQKLAFRGTFPPKAGSKELYPHQQRLSLGIPATPEGLAEAVILAKILATQLWCQTFKWDHYQNYAPLPTIDNQLELWIKEFEVYFWAKRSTSARTTWQKSYYPYLHRLQSLAQSQPHRSPEELIYQTILSIPAHSRSRQLCCTALKALVEFAGIVLPFNIKDLWGNYSQRSLQERQLPCEKTIVEWHDRIPNPRWRFVFGVMATFGLRNHEVFFCDYDNLRSGIDNSVRVLETTKTGSHESWAFPPQWVEQFQLRSGHLPQINTDLTTTTLQRIGQQVTQQFQRYGIPFTPYDLRHAWAVRTIHYGLSDTIAAQMMGHSVAIHHRTYHRWLTRRDQEQAVKQVLSPKYLSSPEV
ncbi:MAG: site-specific integrase [Cyanobacteria bacterium KgW148]|nr:site-specific integrase [Cyanobacteria bacterium KgW148]